MNRWRDEATVQNAFRVAAHALNARQEMLTRSSSMDAQRSLFDAQQKWAQLELAREINQVTLYKALEGGWSQSLKMADR